MPDHQGQGILFERGMWGTYRVAPFQPGSTTSREGSKAIERERLTVAAHIVDALIDVAPSGRTIAELALLVTIRRGRHTTEGTICGRICGEKPELAGVVVKSGKTRTNASGVAADEYVLAGLVKHEEEVSR